MLNSQNFLTANRNHFSYLINVTETHIKQWQHDRFCSALYSLILVAWLFMEVQKGRNIPNRYLKLSFFCLEYQYHLGLCCICIADDVVAHYEMERTGQRLEDIVLSLSEFTSRKWSSASPCYLHVFIPQVMSLWCCEFVEQGTDFSWVVSLVAELYLKVEHFNLFLFCSLIFPEVWASGRILLFRVFPDEEGKQMHECIITLCSCRSTLCPRLLIGKALLHLIQYLTIEERQILQMKWAYTHTDRPVLPYYCVVIRLVSTCRAWVHDLKGLLILTYYTVLSYANLQRRSDSDYPKSQETLRGEDMLAIGNAQQLQ